LKETIASCIFLIHQGDNLTTYTELPEENEQIKRTQQTIKDNGNTIYMQLIQALNIDLVIEAILKTLNYQIVQHYSSGKKHKALS
jgi:hypothetical protein